ncbi:Mu-like prophage major head subunit gpT family protein [Limnobaculum zhutongyuii]|uniref:Mu-like prophage major head subunit gpT family protein n=1 Tax=Limnobaculum zhutongyuii TaxID=2498113 RepID=UPI001FE590D4|nr:Mu-like prophage major head subunit gpT family protein [Limnobaculum zhutongyuii]
MIINAGTIKNIYVGLKTLFQKAFKETDSDWEKLAMKVTSTTSEEHYWWLDRFPKLKKWIGEKVVKALGAFKYTLVNEDYEATVAIKRNHIKDNQLAGYNIQASAAGKSAKEWPADLVFALLPGGFINECYDGQPFFDTDHPVGKSFVSNKGEKKPYPLLRLRQQKPVTGQQERQCENLRMMKAQH